MAPEIETYVEPDEPSVDGGDGEDERTLRVAVHAYDGADHFDAGIQLFGQDTEDPDRFAQVLLAASLALAALRGSDCEWATRQRFAAYDGTTALQP